MGHTQKPKYLYSNTGYHMITMVTTKKKTTQLGLRIENELLEKIERLAELESIDKMSWIRRALATFIQGEETGVIDDAIEDYIALRIDETEFKKYSKLKDVPSDIKNSRAEFLKFIIQKNKEDTKRR